VTSIALDFYMEIQLDIGIRRCLGVEVDGCDHKDKFEDALDAPLFADGVLRSFDANQVDDLRIVFARIPISEKATFKLREWIVALIMMVKEEGDMPPFVNLLIDIEKGWPSNMFTGPTNIVTDAFPLEPDMTDGILDTLVYNETEIARLQVLFPTWCLHSATSCAVWVYSQKLRPCSEIHPVPICKVPAGGRQPGGA
jgi:hypothetical protein